MMPRMPKSFIPPKMAKNTSKVCIRTREPTSLGLKKYYTLFPIHEYLREETQDNPYWVQWGDGENKQSGSLTLSQIVDIVKSNKSLEVLEGDTGWKKWEDHLELRKKILKALKS